MQKDDVRVKPFLSHTKIADDARFEIARLSATNAAQTVAAIYNVSRSFQRETDFLRRHANFGFD
jgi:hypothetical protein